MEEKNYEAMSKESLIIALKESEKKLDETKKTAEFWYKHHSELKIKFEAVKSMLEAIVRITD